MKKLETFGIKPHDASLKNDGQKWSIMEKLLLGLTLDQYIGQALRNKLNWLFAIIFAIGIPVILYRFVFSLGAVTHGSYDYPWGLFLGFGLFCMVPLSASGFMLGTTVEIFGRHDFEPIERLALLNGLLGYFFAVVYLLVDLGQPWRLSYPMVYSFGPAAVLFLVGWHVATYLSVQVMEVSTAFFEWIGFQRGYDFIRKGTIGLTVSGVILSTLHQGALGALFLYAPGKVHPLWYSAPFQWILFFISSIPAGLCMVISVSTIVIYTMKWRCDKRFIDNLDWITIALAKGAAMGLSTYIIMKFIAVAHDNEWAYFFTGWGAWWWFEMLGFVILPLAILSYGIRHKLVGLCRIGAFLTVFGILLNRLNTALIAFNWQLYQEIPHYLEIIIAITIFAIYIATYRFILARLPILYKFRSQAEE
ncbi:MAG: polysulfide reductase [Deltaproteobacteria bacterium]|nr:MAG: polysulfide reductase [Deltaproteobacteria bacterium]RLB75492.1 MAG: polysulfide reductase [Deltaproteobacteria bacterium]